MLYLFTFLQCKCIFLLEIVVILNKVVIFVVYYYNTRNKLVTLKFATMKLYQNKYPIKDNTEYVVDYVYDNPSGENFYFQLVRLSDNAILCAHKDQSAIILHCWSVGISKEKVAFI